MVGEAGAQSGMEPDNDRRQVKASLLSLSGDIDQARRWVLSRYPSVSIEPIRKNDLKEQSKLAYLRKLRKRKRDLFVVFCDRLEWQAGRSLMLLYGLLSGARHSIIADGHGNFIERSILGGIFKEIPRLAFEMSCGALVIFISWLLTWVIKIALWLRGDRKPRFKPGAGRRSIVFIRSTPISGTQIGGSTSHILGFTDGAVALGHRVRFVSNDVIPGVKKEKTPVDVIRPSTLFSTTRTTFELWNNLVFTWGAYIAVRETQPDFIYQRYSRFTWAGVVISLLTGLPLILEYNGSEVWIGKHWDNVRMLGLLKRFEEVNLAGANAIFVVSEAERKNLITLGIPEDKIHVNPNGVDVDCFCPDGSGKLIRRSLGIDDRVVVGFVGTFGPWHGVLALAEAIAKMPADSNCHFLIIGDGTLKQDVESIIERAKCTHRVTFTGRIGHVRVPAYLDACDILVSPHVPMVDGSEFFGSPTKLFEYMAMGKGIVASRLGQIGQVIRHNENGLLIEPGDVSGIVAGVLRLARDAELRKRLGQQARKDVIDNYTWEQNARRVFDAFEELTRNA